MAEPGRRKATKRRGGGRERRMRTLENEKGSKTQLALVSESLLNQRFPTVVETLPNLAKKFAEKTKF